MPKGSLCWDFRYRKNLSIVLFKNLITNSDNTLLIFLRQLFAIYKLAFSEISIEQHLREEMWMTPGEQRMQLSVLNLQSKGTLQWYFSAQCESRAQWIWEKTDNFYLHCAGLLNFSWIVGKEKVVVNKVHIKRPLYFSKVEREGILAILCLIGIFQILNVISQNTQGSVSQVYGHISLQKWCLDSRRAGEVSEIKWIHNHAPGSFNLVHFTLPTLPPVFPTEGRFGKDAGLASSTAPSHTATNPWPCTALHKLLLDHL